ncbi:oxygen-independent coproporphyrinogen-3 oxidase [Desulfohalotomaculum tongense]|uniref:radical SAM family heme chaperone HemW n=1 Tax=Desulforadius tongensis TaxID=1216062 RepID=UPI001956DBA4|nr:radical SAM family heme chaperone HemW [Desulforadius tongensis]MBM7855705.1 oxygen-independent coproporphyrinogen-3 oxidase [Desulforadius tongensis]
MDIGLYIHVPFCLQKCRYCDFVSYPYNKDDARSYLQALEREMQYYARRLTPGRRVSTVFIGGGTPTVLETGDLTKLLENARRYFQWSEDAEVTVEANPGTINKHKLYMLHQMGVNRLSLGVQAYQSRLLNLLGRVHDYRQVLQGVSAARQVGFNNLNLDLIFGIPGQSLKDWQESLAMLADLQPEHLACYSLQLEEGTPLAAAVERGEVTPCREELELKMYNKLIDFLTARGYRHYEISNFSKPGCQCRHNLLYWHNGEYLGLGPAAHSHLDMQRWSNTASIRQYTGQVLKNVPPVTERHKLTKKDVMIETAFMGLRLLQGLDRNEFYRRFGQRITDVWPEEVKKLCHQGLLELTDTHLRLTGKGLRLANLVFREFV